MRKKILSFVLAAVLVGAVVPALPAVSVSDGNQGIWYDPSNPDASGDIINNTVVYSGASIFSGVVGYMAKGTKVNILETTTDAYGVKWVKVKEHNSESNVEGYIKASNFNQYIY